MRISIFSCALSLSLPLLAAACPLPLASLPTYLNAPNIFYRAVTGRELQEVTTIYRVGQSPTRHATIPGDFSFAGGLYVFRVGVLFPLPVLPLVLKII